MLPSVDVPILRLARELGVREQLHRQAGLTVGGRDPRAAE